MQYALKTNIGKRAENEDLARIPRGNEAVPLIAVSDGMGGHAAGATAAKLVILGLEEELPHLYDDDPIRFLKRAISRVNLDVYRTAEDDASLRGMGATLVCALLYSNRFIAANVGDSRIYHFDGEQLTQVSRDHTLVQLLVDDGEITPEEARVHPRRNIITRAMGTGVRTDIDIFDRTWREDDILLLCSDGLSGVLTQDGMRDILAAAPDLEQAANALIQAALDACASDNITVVLARCSGGQCA